MSPRPVSRSNSAQRRSPASPCEVSAAALTALALQGLDRVPPQLGHAHATILPGLRGRRLRCGGPAPRGSRRRAAGPGAAAARRPRSGSVPSWARPSAVLPSSAGAARCLPICSRQPGLAVTTTSGAPSGCSRPCGPQLRRRVRHRPCCRCPPSRSRAPPPGCRRPRGPGSCAAPPAAGCARCWRVPEVAGVVVGHPGADRVPRGPGPERVEHLVHVADLGAERRGPLRPLGVVGEQVAVVLHGRPAAGDVGDDVVDVQGAEDRRSRAGRGRARRPRGRRAAPARRSTVASRGASTSQPSAASTRTVAALTRWKNTSCTQPVSSATVARRSPTAGVRSGSRANASRSDTGGSSDSSAPSRPGSFAASVRDGREPAQLLVDRPGHRGGPQPPLVGEQREDRLAEQPVGGLAADVALDLRAHRLDQLVVLHAGRAGGDARHAAQAGVDVLGERPVRPISPFSARFIR